MRGPRRWVRVPKINYGPEIRFGFAVTFEHRYRTGPLGRREKMLTVSVLLGRDLYRFIRS